jgi:quinol monooxygenase YgiN
MSVRLVLTVTAKAGKTAELAAAYKERCRAAQQEPGCEQFEVFQGVEHPERFVVLERWKDAAALETHAQLNLAKPSRVRELCEGVVQREDYTYNRTR